MDRLEEKSDVKIEIYSFFSSVWVLQELKDHPLFKKTKFITLALNDKYRDYIQLKVLKGTLTTPE